MDFAVWEFPCNDDLKNPAGTVVGVQKIHSLQIFVVMEISLLVLMCNSLENMYESS